jgi:hypothetical protein
VSFDRKQRPHSSRFFVLVVVVSTLTDLATAVNSQGKEIHDLESMAIESLEHASCGVSHIMSMQAKLQQSSQENKHLYAAAIGVVLFVCAHWIFWSRFEADHDTDMPEHP